MVFWRPVKSSANPTRGAKVFQAVWLIITGTPSPASGQIKRKPDARGEGVPVIINQTAGNSIASGYADSIHVEPHVRERNAGNRCEARSVRVQGVVGQENRRLLGVVKVGIEI